MNGTYGTKKPATITGTDYDIFYNYKPSRSTDTADSVTFTKLDNNLLQSATYTDNEATTDADRTRVLAGMYNLRLPLDVFSQAGIYTVYITPKEVKGTIIDVSNLAGFPNVNGVVINATQFSGLGEDVNTPNGLVGYRIEYYDLVGGTTKTGEYRIITSSNKCEPLQQSAASTSVAYQFNENSNLIFCTVTPSTNMSFASTTTSTPFIGRPSQTISIVNTKFNPLSLEIEITEHDIESLTTMLEGDQIRNLDLGMITTFNKDGEIYHQSTYGTVTNSERSINHDVKITNEDVINTAEADKYQEIKQVL